MGAIATWRLSHMFLNENGPFKVFRRVRIALGVVYYSNDDDSDAANSVLTAKYEITTCIWCLSMWVGGLVAAALWMWPGVFVWFLMPYVFSAFAVSWNHWHGIK